ncbi:MAG: winged helix-turn-helix transcriptional regulator [Planctomycetaceae bacterium]|nr:winged helix-turn-helix transcriptional regulator [Planctomycetaceae bacterium]
MAKKSSGEPAWLDPSERMKIIFYCSELSPAECNVLQAISFHMMKRPTCHPSQIRLSKMTNLNRTTVNRRIQDLEKRGFLKTRARSGKLEQSLEYRINWELLRKHVDESLLTKEERERLKPDTVSKSEKPIAGEHNCNDVKVLQENTTPVAGDNNPLLQETTTPVVPCYTEGEKEREIRKTTKGGERPEANEAEPLVERETEQKREAIPEETGFTLEELEGEWDDDDELHFDEEEEELEDANPEETQLLQLKEELKLPDSVETIPILVEEFKKRIKRGFYSAYREAELPPPSLAGIIADLRKISHLEFDCQLSLGGMFCQPANLERLFHRLTNEEDGILANHADLLHSFIRQTVEALADNEAARVTKSQALTLSEIGEKLEPYLRRETSEAEKEYVLLEIREEADRQLKAEQDREKRIEKKMRHLEEALAHPTSTAPKEATA